MTATVCSVPQEKLQPLRGLVARIGEKYSVDIEAKVQAGSMFLRLLQPQFGSLCLQSQSKDVLRVFHYPPAADLGYAGAAHSPEEFVDRDMDFLVREGGWQPIDYTSTNLQSKDPLQLEIYAEAWGLELAKEGWIDDAELVECQLD